MRRSRKIVILLAFVAACCLRVQAQPAGKLKNNMAAQGELITKNLKHKTKTGIAFLVFTCCFLVLRAQPTIVHDYEFTTGVDSSLWVDMTVSTPWVPLIVCRYQLPFSFFFYDRDYTAVDMYRDGSLSFPPSWDNAPYNYFPNQLGQVGVDATGIFGYRNDYTNDYMSNPGFVYMRSLEYGSEGHRVVVIQLGSFLNHDVVNNFQIHLHEEDYSITIVYGERAFAGSTPVGIGLLFGANLAAIVNQNSHTVSTQATGTPPTSWPGQYRYYRFVPSDSICPIPRDFSAELVWESENDDIRLTWSDCSVIDSFRVEYGPTGFAEGSGTSMMVHGTQAVIHDLHTAEEIEARVYAQCAHGESGYASATIIPCPTPAALVMSNVSLTSDDLILKWDSLPRYHSYRVEYGPPGFAEGTGTTLTSNTASVLLPTLSPDEDFEARLYAQCPYGESDYISLLFHVPCPLSDNNKIHYASLHCDGVKCCTGTFHNPADVNSPANILDFGSDSSASRHTVHSDTSERDPRTGNRLRTVPEGFCSSVRLGNWLGGGEQESIFYTIDVDTNEFDLLILRYALVEEQPNHDPLDQPHFDLDITTSAGVSISPCYHGNFVSGDLSGWNRVPGLVEVLWRDWDAVGVVLSPLHGQTIVVALSNYDCAYTAHYGYAYFTLQTGTKRILAESCGNEIVNTFRAPQGFSYRWYSASDTATTLSTADTLHVSTAGDYGCQVSYRLSEQVCGFSLSTYAGGRYPVAAFALQPLDSCGALCRFANQSVISRDSAHTQLTDFPCEEYLWRFDDGTTSTVANPVHGFDEGVHTVTLYAMLAGGACVDSVSQTFSVVFQYDTVDVAICEGDVYRFFGQELSEAGEYVHADVCHYTTLHLQVNPVYDTQLYDSYQQGDYYSFDGVGCYRPGVYERRYVTVEGCDSTVTLYLSCLDVRDTVVCSSSLPVEWEGVPFYGAGSDTLRFACAGGTDSIVVLNLGVLQQPLPSIVPEAFCHEPGGYSLVLPDSLCYRWSSWPEDTSLPTGWVRSGEMPNPVLLSPADTTVYGLEAERCDTVHCPWRDTFQLAPVQPVEARLAVLPDTLDMDNLTLTAIDRTLRPHERQWFVDGLLSSSTDSMMVYLSSLSEDSVQVMLVVTTPDCSDTAYATVPLRVQMLWFPNVFTPDEPTNNLFRGYGVNVRDYDLKVFTRWGDCIFHTTDINQGWNGTYRGVKSPIAAYAYLCHYTTLEGRREVAKGTVTLLR